MQKYKPQKIPEEDKLRIIPMAVGTDEYKLHIEWSVQPDFVAISNRDRSDKPIHEVRIEGDRGIINQTLTRLIDVLKKMKSAMMAETHGESQALPKIPLSEFGLVVEGSKYKRSESDLIFIKRVKDEAKISISKENLDPFIKELEGFPSIYTSWGC